MFGAVLALFFTQWANLSMLQFMALQSWCMIWAIILEVPSGALTDKIGRVRSLQLGVLLAMAGFTLYVATKNYYIFMLSETILAAGFAMFSGTEESFIYETLEDENRKEEFQIIIGKYGSVGLFSLIVAAPIGGFVAQYLGLQYPVLLMDIPLSIAFFALFFAKEPKAHMEKEKKEYVKIIRCGMRYFKEHKLIKQLTLESSILSTIGFLSIWVYQIVLKNLGVSQFVISLTFTISVAFEILILNTYLKLQKILKSNKRFMTIQALLTGTFLIVLGFSGSAVISIICTILVIGFSMTRSTISMNYINANIKSADRATVISCSNLFTSLGKMLTFITTGYFADKIGITQVVTILGILVVGMGVASRIKEEDLKIN